VKQDSRYQEKEMHARRIEKFLKGENHTNLGGEIKSEAI
jgi:hypothetical protein